MAISQTHFCIALTFACLAFILVCIADEAKKDDGDTKTLRGKDVSAKILGRSGKILIVRSDDDKDDEKDGKDRDTDRDSESKDSLDKKDDYKDSGDSKDTVDKKDVDDKDSPDDADVKDYDDDDDDDDDDFRDDNEDLLSFELDEIKEKDADGNEVDDEHSVDSFDDVNFQFSPIRRVSKFHGLAVVSVNLSTSLKTPTEVNLGIMVYLFLEAGVIKFGNETFFVQAGTVKFNIEISNWDFCEDSSLLCSTRKAGKYLDLTMKIKSLDSPTEVDDDDDDRKKAKKPAVCVDKDDDKDDDDDDDDADDDDDDCPKIYNMGGDSEMLLNRGVMIDDDNYIAMPVGFPKLETDDGTKKFVFRIPKFNKKALVDPSITPGKKAARHSGAASWLRLNVTFAFLLQVAAMLAAH